MEISDFVAINEKNKKTHSLKIMQLYFSICVETESVFDQIFRNINSGSNKKSNIYRNMDLLLNYFPAIENTVVVLNLTGESWRVKPFEAMFYNHRISIQERADIEDRKKLKQEGIKDNNNQNDYSRKQSWWSQYNAVKHQRYENFDQANLQNLIEALSALHLLNVLLAFSSNNVDTKDYCTTYLLIPVDFQPPILRTLNYSLELMANGIRCYVCNINNLKF